MFAPDSQLKKIEGNAFTYSLKRLALPSSVSELQKGWCFQVEFNITISPENKYFKQIEGGMVIGKSNIENEEYDILVYVDRDIKTVKIPPYIKKVGSYSFCLSSVEEVFIPAEVTEICEGAFYRCKDIRKVEIESNSKLKIIRNDAFFSASIPEFTLPPSVTQICTCSFCYCEKLTKFEIPHNSELQIIEERALPLCNKITEIFIPSHVMKISKSAFEWCTSLQKIEFASDSKLQTIEQKAFYNCGIKSFTFPDNLSDLQIGWCHGLDKLTDITISPKNKHFKKIEGNMIVGKSKIENDEYDVIIYVNRDITTVEIPPNIKKIGSFSFSQSFIEKVFIPTEIIEICEGAFHSCKFIQKVEFASDSKLQTIDKEAFYGCTFHEISIPKHVKQLCNSCFAWCLNLESVEIPENSELEKIESAALSVTCIEEISIPSNLSVLEEKWCSGNNHLTSFSISPNNSFFTDFEGKMIVEKSNKKGDVYDIISFVNRDVTEIEIPSSITKISSDAFENSDIEKIFIPSHVSEMSAFSFYCSKLHEIEIDPNSNLQKIDKYTFYNCCLNNVFIPNNVTQICEYSFSYCQFLKYVNLMPDSKLHTIDQYAFIKTLIRSIFIPQSVAVIHECSFETNLLIFELGDVSNLKLIADEFNYVNDLILMVPIKI